MTLVQLDGDQFYRVRSHLDGMEHNLILNAAIERTTPGRVYVDQLESPRTAFICTVEGYYLLGDADNQAFNRELSELILEVIFQGDRLREGENEFTLYYHSQDWEDQMDVIFKGKYPLKATRRCYACQEVLIDWRDKIPPDTHIVPVDAQFLRRTYLANITEVNAWINTNWNSVEDFLHLGQAFCTVRADAILSWCIADCVSDSMCEVGITTDPAYRRRGLATLTAAACVESLLSSGVTSVGWHCAEENLGSRGVAEKVGFKLVRRYPIYFCAYNDARQLAINGHYRIREQQYAEALEWYERSIEYTDVPGWALYDTACALARLGRRQSALERLYQAIEKGWDNLEHTLVDDDLIGLHGTSEWGLFIAHFRRTVLKIDYGKM